MPVLYRQLPDGRDVEVEIDGADGDDIQIYGAVFCETGAPVPDHDLDQLLRIDYAVFYEAWLEAKIAKAEDYWEGDR
jgi:hypothetical protein